MAAMKDSGIEWIGIIPEEWSVGRISYRYNLALGKMIEPDAGDSERAQYPYLCAANIKWNGVDTSINKKMYFSASERLQYDVKRGDLLITEGGSVGTSCIYDEEFGTVCYMQNSVIRARSRNSNQNVFLRYWLEFVCNSGYLDALCNKATISHYTKDKVSKTPLVLIGDSETKAIANKLDEDCAEIEALASTIEKQITILERYRASVIHEAVTRGIDPTCPFKKSGIDWIEEIPQGWNITKIKYVSTLCNGLDYSSEDVCDPSDKRAVLVVRSSNVRNGQMVHADDVYVDMRIPETCRLRKGDLVIVRANGSAELVDKSAIFNSEEECAAGGFMLICRSDATRYLRWLLQSDLLGFHRSRFSTTTIGRISNALLGNMTVPWPKETERKAIADYLDARTAAIDAVLETKRKQLDVLNRRRQSLIYEYVTGKRRVAKED